MPLGREHLDKAHCADPDCNEDHSGELYFHAFCHPEAPPWAKYQNGVIYFICFICDNPVTSIAVAAQSTISLKR